MKKCFREVVTERVGPVVIASDVIPVTEDEVLNAKADFISSGLCDHSLIYDEEDWLFDFRMCAVCGKGLGTV